MIRPKGRFPLGILLTGAISFLLSGAACWYAAPHFIADPMESLREQTPVRTWLDRNGRVIHLERTFDSQWRFPVPLERISPHAVRVILAAEDSSFFSHAGIDYGAVLRAAFQNLTSFRIISGASTITMQLAGMCIPEKRHSMRRKILQSVYARKLEMCHSKRFILEEYLNRIPFGGKIYGIEAASRYYFGLKAADLNPAESALLCGIPQKPNRFRPDRGIEAALERRRIVLKLLVRAGKMTQEETDRIREKVFLRLRDFRYPADFELLSRRTETYHFLTMARKENLPFRVVTSIDRELQDRVLRILRIWCGSLESVSDAAAVLIDNRTHEVLVYLGTLRFDSGSSGQVDSVRAVRSAGSALKPFLYAEAVDGGKIVSSTILNDSPVRYGDYVPGNYDGKYRGKVTAEYALSRSLNVPAVGIAAMLGEKRCLALFEKLGIGVNLKDGRAGLSLALGTAGHTLYDITRAYSALTGNGDLPELSFFPGKVPEFRKKSVFLPQTSAMTASMLRSLPLPGTSCPVSWKTGTSNGTRDAWCFAFTEDYTLGIWVGNKSGKSSPNLVGATAAAPVAGEIFDLLYAGTPPPRLPDENTIFETRPLCEVSGLTPGPFCERRIPRFVIPGLPLVSCSSCGEKRRKPPRILSPLPQHYIPRIGRKTVALALKADLEKVSWYVNGEFVGKGGILHEFAVGKRYAVRCASDQGESEIRLSVGENPASSRMERSSSSVTDTMTPSR